MKSPLTEELASVAQGAVAAIPGMFWGGVDVIVDDATGRAYVIEVNANPGISGAEHPTLGDRRRLGKAIWEIISRETEPEALQPPPPLGALERPTRVLEGASAVPLHDLFRSHVSQQDLAVEDVLRSV